MSEHAGVPGKMPSLATGCRKRWGLQLRLRVVADEAVDEGGHQRDDDGGHKGAAEAGDVEAGAEQPVGEPRGDVEQKRVHHEIEDAQGEHGHRQREDLQNRLDGTC